MDVTLCAAGVVGGVLTTGGGSSGALGYVPHVRSGGQLQQDMRHVYDVAVCISREESAAYWGEFVQCC